MGVNDSDLLTIERMAKGDVVFCATGITEGFLLKGVRYSTKYIATHSLVMRSETKTVRFVEAFHDEPTQRKYYEKTKCKGGVA